MTLVWTGLLLLAAAAAGAYFARTARARIRSLRSTETLTVRELRDLHSAAVGAVGEGYFRQQCTVVGTARPHKNGVLRSELKKVACVWHRHKVTRKYEETRRDGQGRTRRETHSEVASRYSSPTAFFIQDDTGKLVVRPGDADFTGAEKVLDRFRPYRSRGRGAELDLGPFTVRSHGSGTIGYKQEEWIVRPGRRISVHGEASDADGRLSLGAPADGGVFIMAAKPQEEVVRGERRKLLGFGLGAAAAALAGLGVLVGALLS